jgi:T1SS-143 domain-containing protein
MASNNIILAKPKAETTVDYTLPESESAKLSFSPEDISGLRLDGNGGLVISFAEGGHVTISNFQSFIDNGNTLSLADGTNVDPRLLFNTLGGSEGSNPFVPSDAIRIGVPADDTTREITMESGKKYVLNFDLSETQGADIKNGDMVISFANGGKIVINDYEQVMAGVTPPELSIASKTCVVTGDELITNIQALAASSTVTTEEVVVIEEETTVRKSKVADADLQGADDIGANGETDLGYQVAQVEPKAGDADDMAEAAQQFAEVEPAAGDAGGAGARNSGYGFNSRPTADPFAGKDDIGAIDPTQLGYRAPVIEPIPGFVPPVANPIVVGPVDDFVDETSLTDGSIIRTGTIGVNYGDGGPAGINPNGTFDSSGSRTDNKLTSGGQDVTAVVVGNGYEGRTPDGTLIFKLTVDSATGEYEFTLLENLDHADGTDPNDVINLNFGIVVNNTAGQSANTTVTIRVADDAPEIGDDEKTVDETDLGPLLVTGNLLVSAGQDTPAVVTTAGSFASSGSQKDGVLTSDGKAITVTWTPNGYEGVADGNIIFTLAISSTGGYTYTQYGNLDHADPNNPNDIIKLTFGVKVTDYDGDSEPGYIVINVKDDAPRFVDCGCGSKPTPGHAVYTIDETNLVGGAIVVTDGVQVDFGADGPATNAFALKADSFTASGSMKGDALTHNGVPVVVTLEGGKYVGKAGGITVFTLEIDPTSGDYKFTLLDNLDHKDVNDINDIITLKFGFTAADSEGDTVEGSITINVKDDAPIAHDDINNFNTALGDATGNVMTGLNGGPGAADVLSQDDGNRVVKIKFGNTEIDVPETGTVSIDGANGKLTISADGTYTYEPFMTVVGGTGVSTAKEFTAGPALPDFDYEALDPAEQASKGIAPGNMDVTAGDTIKINFVSENGSTHNSVGLFTVDASGKIKLTNPLIVDTESAGPTTISHTVGADAVKAGMFLISGWGGASDPLLSTLDYSNGSLNVIYKHGTPDARPATINDNAADIKLVYTSNGGVDTVVDRQVFFSSERGGSSSLNTGGDVRVVSGIPGDDNTVLRISFEDGRPSDNDYNDAIFDIQIITKDCGCGSGIGDKFEYTIRDGDGDESKANLTLNGKDLTDYKPIFTGPEVEIVDETNLAGGVLSETGTINVNFGGDGPGTINAGGTFTSTGSKLNNALTSNGQAVDVTVSGNTYTGKTAAGVVVFTLTINQTTGAYEFKLFEQLDHADGSNPNDAIDLNFGVVAIDCDGDETRTNLTVRVLDDAPDARDDVLSVAAGATTNGNVITNDVVGQDTPGSVISITFKGTTQNVPTDGTNLVIVGDFGTLSINKDGVYSYVAKDVTANSTDEFTYVLRDHDGDTDPAKLKITVLDKDYAPEIIEPAIKIVDETNLVGGAITQGGTIVANFFGDGPGTFGGTGTFTSSGSRTGDTLSHNGSPVSVTMSGNTYTGTSASGVTVFTLTINPTTGAYEFKLLEQLDHKDGSNANDAIDLHFGIKATDADNDTVSTTLTVRVLDDAPTISGDAKTIDETNLSSGPITVTGTLVHNYGQDGAGTISEGPASAFVAGGSLKGGALSSGGVPIVVTLEGGKFVGKAGAVVVFEMNIKADGTYEFTQFKGLDHNDPNNANDEITLSFPAQITDYDTDKAVAPVVITVRDDAPRFPPENPDNPPEDPENPPGNPGDPNDPAMGNGYRIVDETNLSGGQIVTEGKLNADFGADAPGSYALKPGTFNSYGSKTGGNLTSNGVPVVVTLEGGKFVGKAGAITVFTLELNATTGAYKFTLLEQLDHANGSNPNDVINLVFGVEAADSEGDKVNGTIRIDVRDDAPDAKDDTITVNENNTATGNVITNDNVGQDVQGTITQVVYKGTTHTMPNNGVLTINADYGTLTINRDGSYTYVTKRVDSDQVDRFTYTLRDHDGDTDTAKLEICVVNGNDIPEIIKPADEIVDETNLVAGVVSETGSVTANFFGDGPGTFAATGTFTSSGSRTGDTLSHNGSPVTVTLSGNTYTGKSASGVTVFTLVVNANGSYKFDLYQQLDHANGSDPNDIINLNFGIKAVDKQGDTATTTLTVKVKDDAPDARDDTVNVDETKTATGNVITNDIVGQDAPGTITQVVYKGTTYTLPANGTNITIPADHGTLTINNTGAYTYVAKNVSADVKDNFTYTLRDHDGDIDTAKLEVCIFDKDDQPIIATPGIKVVDETNLASGNVSTTGTITANFGDDGPGSFGGTGSFTSSGSRTGNTLSSGGSPVNVTFSNGTYTGTTATGITVFTLVVNSNGSYTFRLLKPLDHADGNNPNDVINLNFGIIARDSDNDTATTTLTVQVKDDAPIARADYCTLYTHENSVSSNALTNDAFGADGAGRITQISFGNNVVNVPTSGSATIYGNYGYVVLSANGSYTYHLTNKSAPVASENFHYTIVDKDGDSASALMQFNIIKYAGGTSTGSEGNDTMYGIPGNDTMYGNGGDDWLYGNAGDDTLHGGAGNDRLVGGLGNDVLYGGSGADTFVYQTINDGVDRIKDFNRGEGDKLDLSALLGGFDPLTESINSFVFATQSGGNTTIHVNPNGSGAGGATALAVLEGVNVSVSDLFNNGSIIH